MEFRHLEAILSQFEDALKGENLKRTWPLGSHCPNAKAVIKNRIFSSVVIPWFTLFDLTYSFLHKTSRNLLHCLDALLSFDSKYANVLLISIIYAN